MATLWCNTEIISLILPMEPCLCPLHLINLLPLELCLCPLHLINLLPLEPCLCPLHLINLSPFFINGKGIFTSGAPPPDRVSSYGASSCTSKTYKHSKNIHFCSRNNSKSLANIFKGFPWKWFCKDTCSFVPTYSILMFFSATYSSRKWYLIGMCFVLECITGFF